MANKMIDIVNAISKAVYNKHHGGGADFGLRRDEEDSGVILDGFNIRFVGNKLIVSYNSEERFENAHDPNFEQKITDTIDDIVSAIKREYKKHGGQGSLKLNKDGEAVVRVETVNRRTVKVTANIVYTIGNLGEVDSVDIEVSELTKDAQKAQKEFEKTQSDNKKLDEAYRNFLSFLPEGKLYG